MKWLLAMGLLGVSSAYLYHRYTSLVVPAPAPPQPAPPVTIKDTAFLSQIDLARIKASARDPDPDVRWKALELLYTLGDPDIAKLLVNAVSADSDPENRVRAIKLLESRKDIATLHGLLRGLQDPEKEVRLAALRGISESGDPAAIPGVAEVAAKDYEPDVRIEAMQVLGRFQDQRKEELAKLAARLRQEYEAAVERAAKKELENR